MKKVCNIIVFILLFLAVGFFFVGIMWDASISLVGVFTSLIVIKLVMVFEDVLDNSK